MKQEICSEAENMLHGMVDILCNISVFSDSVVRSSALEINDQEKDVLHQGAILAQKGAETLESCALDPSGWTLPATRNDPLFEAEAETLEKMIQQVSLGRYLVAHLLRRTQKDSASAGEFASRYAAHKLRLNLTKLHNVFSGFDCQHKSRQEHCPGRNYCLVSTWADRRLKQDQRQAADCRPKKILLVDDDHLVRKAVKRALAGEEAYSLTTAADSQEAVDLLAERSFDIIVADFLMPGQDGCELLRHVQQQWPDVVRILFTASVDNRRVMASLKNGMAAGIIEKPWNNSQLFASLKNASNLSIGP